MYILIYAKDIYIYIYIYIRDGYRGGGARGALAPPPHDCKIYDFKIVNMVKSAKPSISIIGRFIHILF